MVNGDDLLYSALPPELISKAEFLIYILQALGGVIIFYIIFNIINTVINRKRNKKIDQIVSSLEEIKKLLSEQLKYKGVKTPSL